MIAQEAIFSPMFALMGLTIAVLVYMYCLRLPYLIGNKIDTKAVTTPAELAQVMPKHLNTPSDNLKNLFEIPVLFYVVALYLFVTGKVDQPYVIAAWAYVGLRTLHSVIQCTINVVPLRFAAYVLSCFTLIFMIGRAAFEHFAI